MADINDARNTRGRLEREQENLAEADIHEADREAIEAFAGYKRRRTGSIGTISTYMNRLRVSAERAHKPLTAFEGTDDVESLLDAHEAAGTKSASGLNNHLSAIRQFFEFLDGSDTHGHDDYRWRAFIENVEASDTNPGREAVDPEFVLSGSEVTDIREAASHPREGALAEFLADAGPRITLACQMRCGDVGVAGDESGTFRPNPDAIGHKKVDSRQYRLHESQRHLRRWLNEHHPEAPDPPDDAPLFPVKRGYDRANREECALSPSAAESALKGAAEAADIDPDRAHPHNWRRAAVTRMRAKHGMDWEAIQLRTGWSDQSLAEMKQFYRRIDAADKRALVDKQLGISDAEEPEGEAPEPEPCVSCGSDVPPHGTICPACGTDQSLDDPRPPEEVRREQVRETVAEMMGPLADGDLGEDPGLQAFGMMLTSDDLPDTREGDGTGDVSEERAEKVREQLGLD